jgi:small subunit ribosomal protein S9
MVKKENKTEKKEKKTTASKKDSAKKESKKVKDETEKDAKPLEIKDENIEVEDGDLEKIETEEISSDFPKVSGSKKKKYYEAIGRRKTAVARVRLWTAHPTESAESGSFTINGKNHSDYFSTSEMIYVSELALRKMKSLNRFRVSVVVKGGGVVAQAEAIRHGVARALVRFDENFSKKLRRVGFLTRDPRMRERKKPGLKRARRAPQWSKR